MMTCDLPLTFPNNLDKLKLHKKHQPTQLPELLSQFDSWIPRNKTPFHHLFFGRKIIMCQGYKRIIGIFEAFQGDLAGFLKNETWQLIGQGQRYK